METTVTNGGGMRASQLAEKAARAVGDGETAAVELAAVSLALSMASLAGSAAVLAEQARPVPLAAADTLPDEPATPFVRSVDELTDDDFIKPYQLLTGHARAWIGPHDMARARAFYDAIAARLRVDGPGREPEPAEITAATLDAAHVGATVEDEDDDPVARVDDTRRALIAAVLRAASRRVEAEIGGTPHPLELARGLVDAAARVHVTALDGPATGGVIVAPRGLPELSEADLAEANVVYNRARLAAIPTPNVSSQREGLRAALGWYRLRLAGGTPSTGGYDPAKLAPGSVVVAGGRVYINDPDRAGHTDFLTWRFFPKDERGVRWVGHSRVPTDGVLVVDGATLGGAQ